MPHFGLIDENLPEEEQFLMRARLHLRGGKVRLECGDFSGGIAALYDAFIYSLYWFFLTDNELKPYLFNENEAYKEEEILYNILIKYNRIDGEYDVNLLYKIAESALKNELKTFNYDNFLKDFENLMIQLKVIPYDKDLVPQENSITL